ncbi:MAG: glycosyltransferase family 4 protein [Betaproteobacteria bacterium]
MKIAQIAPLAESVPPKLYGGTERVVSYLAEELVRLGHDVTLFASADSETRGRLVACAPRALRLDPGLAEPHTHYALMLERVRSRAAEFDVLHFHIDALHLPLFRPFAAKTLTTMHGRLDLPGTEPLYREFADMPLASISDSQRGPLPGAYWVATVHHGLPAGVCPFNPALRPSARGNYLAFLGRVSPEKGVDRAIEVARLGGMRLRIAAKVDRDDERYFRSQIVPLLDDAEIQGAGAHFVGEVGEADKPGFLGNAAALLFTIDWPEPFGLAMIEAMSCGTPVVAFRRGAVQEIVEDGVTGFIVDSVDEAVAAVRRALALDRRRVRARFEERFTAERMARDYLSVYRALGLRHAGARAA